MCNTYCGRYHQARKPFTGLEVDWNARLVGENQMISLNQLPKYIPLIKDDK